jgi:hypothetical protein
MIAAGMQAVVELVTGDGYAVRMTEPASPYADGGKLLVKLMARHGLTNPALADRVGAGVSTVRAWRAGTALPRLARARAVAEVFGEDGVELLRLWGLDDLGEGFADELAARRELSRFASPPEDSLPTGRDEDDPPRRGPGAIVTVRIALSADAVGSSRWLIGFDEDTGQPWLLQPLRDVRMGP